MFPYIKKAEQINKCQESLENAKDEVELSDGLTNKSALFIPRFILCKIFKNWDFQCRRRSYRHKNNEVK